MAMHLSAHMHLVTDATKATCKINDDATLAFAHITSGEARVLYVEAASPVYARVALAARI